MSLSIDLVVGLSVGVVAGLLLAAGALIFFRFRKRNFWSRKGRTISTLPIRCNDQNASDRHSDATSVESPKLSDADLRALKNTISFSGVPKYSFRDLRKATENFTTEIGHGAFGKVYIASMPTGQRVAVKELMENTKKGEQQFISEVILLGRLHHRNLVNLVGYCTEKGKHMLIYAYMSNGSLFSHLYDQNHETLSWRTRTIIALDVAMGLEYLHDGANPPVLHRDIKSSNILLDDSMRARLADFGLSKEEINTQHASDLKGTFGYLDPEYISSRQFTKRSDVYSFGVLLFELVAAKTPQQGLLDYIELATISMSGSIEWEEIVDPQLKGNYDLEELNELATLAYKCIKKNPKKRPLTREIAQVLNGITTKHNNKFHSRGSSLNTIDGELHTEREIVEVPISDDEVEPPKIDEMRRTDD